MTRRPKKPAGRPRAATPDVAETAARVEKILALRLDGAQFHDLHTYANDPSAEAAEGRGGPPWNLDAPALWELIHRADDILVARVETKRGRAVALQLARRDTLYLRSINAGDYAVALSILRDQATILGMYPKVDELRTLVKAQDKLIAELEAAADAPRQLGPAETSPGEVGPVEGSGAEGEAVEGRPVG